MSCDIELRQNFDLSWMNSWINTEKDGNLCFLSLPSTEEGWILNDENFTCGSSGIRIVICDKAFKLLEKVSKEQILKIISEVIWCLQISMLHRNPEFLSLAENLF